MDIIYESVISFALVTLSSQDLTWTANQTSSSHISRTYALNTSGPSVSGQGKPGDDDYSFSTNHLLRLLPEITTLSQELPTRIKSFFGAGFLTPSTMARLGLSKYVDLVRITIVCTGVTGDLMVTSNTLNFPLSLGLIITVEPRTIL